MTYLANNLAPCIYQYENSIDFSNKIIDIIKQDNRGWKINNQDAVNWQPGDKILGYDEYPVSFSFSVDEHFLMLAKKIFDVATDYSSKNLTTVEGFDSCIIRKYSSDPAFLELESADVDNVSRKVTSISFFTSIDDGAELKFKNFDISIPSVQGQTIVFPSSFAYSFRINKPRDKENFVLVSHFV